MLIGMSIWSVHTCWGVILVILPLEILDSAQRCLHVAAQQRELLVHQSQLDTNATYLRNEVVLYLLEASGVV
jgi:hypothetical protein